MPNCNKRIEKRSYERISEVTFAQNGVRRVPELAPPHRKPDEQIIQDLTDVIDGEIALRNRVQSEKCWDNGCDYIGTHTVLDEPRSRSIYTSWDESFEVADMDGNTISGSVTYTAFGTVFVQTKIEDDFCDERFGNAARDFYNKIYDPNKPTAVPVPGADLIKYWGGLSSIQRKGLKLGKRK